MAKNLRNHIVIATETGTERTVSGGPIYTVTYESDNVFVNVDLGDYVYIEKRAAGAGTSSTVLSTYVYVVTAMSIGDEGGTDDITMAYLYDTAETGNDSPLDLYSGGGTSGEPEQAQHKFVKILGPAFSMFV